MHETEEMMATSQALEVQEKKELVSKEEKTVPARYFVPTTDIFETADALTVVMELPGVDKQALDVNIENGVLRVEGRIDHSARSFTLSNKIDQQQISAQLQDGVLTLTLKKAKEATPRRIAIS